MVGENTWENLWNLKLILTGFKLVSGLRVNFAKSDIFGINLQDNFLQGASHFLSCCIVSLPFKFSGIPVGFNPRRVTTWKPIVEKMKSRLAVWKGKLLSIGRRVTLINYVLSSLPLYFLFSFYKTPKKVVSELTKQQRQFFWAGGIGRNCVSWMSWENVCQPKKNEGLGIKRLELFNNSLLFKWRWRIINEPNALWSDCSVWRHKFLEHFP